MREDFCEPKISIPEPHSGVLTLKIRDPAAKKHSKFSQRIRKELKIDGFPGFGDCPDWIKPMMYREYQVNREFSRSRIFTPKLIFSIFDRQRGFSEDWLRSICSNLTKDLYVALRAAWLSGMIVHKHHMLHAEQTEFSRMRSVIRCRVRASLEVR